MASDLAPLTPSYSHSESSFSPIIQRALAQGQFRSPPQLWHLEEQPAGPWVSVTNSLATTPEQGWKIHLSATIGSAREVLRRALPILVADNASFKVARSVDDLQSLNEGRAGLSQVGKFITVYPNDDAQSVTLASALDQALYEIPHPDVPSDRPLRLGSVVYYRYGSFGQQHVQLPTGEIFSAVAGPDGGLVPDRRTVPYGAPPWVKDPFLSSGVAVDLPERSRLVNERYLLAYKLDESARGSVHLGADITDGRRCIIKRAARDAQVGEDGRDACDRLRHETEVLRRLAETLPVPKVFDLIEDNGESFLAMEDLEGETLSEYVERLASYGQLLSTADVVALGTELAALLGAIHSRGVIYRDLKSSNLIVATDGHLRLVDFEIAYDPSGPDPPEGRGTEGYMSPEASRGEVPTVLDDIYSVGAVLYFLATAAEPSLGPANYELTRRPIALLNPCINALLAAAIERCLAQDAISRFSSMAEVSAALQNSLTPDDSKIAGLKETEISESDESLRHQAKTIAKRLGDSLCAAAGRDPSGGIFWVSSYDSDSGIERRDLSGGSAGVLLSLADLVAEFDDPGHRKALSEGALWLARSKPWAAPLPGLYVGESGVAVALLRASQVLNSRELIETAAQRARAIAALPHASPDLYNGSAGRLRFHLFLWSETREAQHLTYAIEAGEAVLRAGERLADGGMRWTIPPGYEGMSGDTCLGYAHGAAGIGDSLLDLYLACGDERFLQAARSAGQWLAGRSVKVFGDGLDWPAMDSPGNSPAGALWCHGAGGIGRFFLNLSIAGVFPEASAIAEAAAHTVSRGGRRVGPTQCHGLAGNIEFMLDMFQATGNRTFLSDARTLARILEAFAFERNGLLVCSSDSPRIVTTDYMVGYAGVAACFLRLAYPDRRPHQLSVRSFAWRSQPRPWVSLTPTPVT